MRRRSARPRRAAPLRRRVDLGVQVRLPDQVDDPALRLLGLHVQLLRQHVDADHLVDAAERLERHEPGVLDEVRRAGDGEEVVGQHRLARLQLVLRAVEVKSTDPGD